MRFVRFRAEGRVAYGRVEGEQVLPLAGDLFSGRAGDREPAGEARPLADVELLAPVRPGKIVCVGLNYQNHAREFGLAIPDEPLLFIKPPSAVIGPGAPIVLPAMSRRVDYEGELVAVIGRTLSRAAPAEAAAGILGFTCGNDVTARDLQKRDGQWTRAKSFDTFAPLGPWIVAGLDPADLEIATHVNGRRVQSDTTAGMIFPVPDLVAFISQVMTLEPGDAVFTGTPAGVGPLAPGDVVEVEIAGIGRLANPVRGAVR